MPPEPDPLPAAAAAAAAAAPCATPVQAPTQAPVQQAPHTPRQKPRPKPTPAPVQQQPRQSGPAASLPAHGTVKGIDVSNHQGTIDWSDVADDGVQVAYLKASEHTGYTDPYYEENRRKANRMGITVGAYHFARPDTESGGSVASDARAEAKHFLSVAKPQPGDLLPALDLEATELSPADTAKWSQVWLDTVAAATGRRPIIYTSPAFWENQVADSGRIANDHPLWVAHWGTSSPDTPGAWDAWNGWQYTSDGTVDGIAGRVDMNKVANPQSLVL